MTFRDLHHAELPLLLPNAWDVGSALGFVGAGFPATAVAVATAVRDGGPVPDATAYPEMQERLIRYQASP